MIVVDSPATHSSLGTDGTSAVDVMPPRLTLGAPL
jgi:hypothetical protein